MIFDLSLRGYFFFLKALSLWILHSQKTALCLAPRLNDRMHSHGTPYKKDEHMIWVSEAIITPYGAYMVAT